MTIGPKNVTLNAACVSLHAQHLRRGAARITVWLMETPNEPLGKWPTPRKGWFVDVEGYAEPRLFTGDAMTMHRERWFPLHRYAEACQDFARMVGCLLPLTDEQVTDLMDAWGGDVLR